MSSQPSLGLAKTNTGQSLAARSKEQEKNNAGQSLAAGSTEPEREDATPSAATVGPVAPADTRRSRSPHRSSNRDGGHTLDPDEDSEEAFEMVQSILNFEATFDNYSDSSDERNG